MSVEELLAAYQLQQAEEQKLLDQQNNILLQVFALNCQVWLGGVLVDLKPGEPIIGDDNLRLPITFDGITGNVIWSSKTGDAELSFMGLSVLTTTLPWGTVGKIRYPIPASSPGLAKVLLGVREMVQSSQGIQDGE